MIVKAKDLSWGRTSNFSQLVYSIDQKESVREVIRASRSALLAHGLGRSYGDVALNESGSLLRVAGMRNVLEFDPSSGLLRCESGVSLGQILQYCSKENWFPPVLPGTAQVTVGGAIANDIHGKNHSSEGSFGNHVCAMELMTGEGEIKHCSLSENTPLFEATIGGLGLTGLILSATIQLKKRTSVFIESENIFVEDIDQLLRIAEDSRKKYEYTIAWINTTARKRSLGTGVFIRANHTTKTPQSVKPTKVISIPFEAPRFILNNYSMKAFNAFYQCVQLRKKKSITDYNAFFFPLDTIEKWNKLYGSSGFYQYQCALPYGAETSLYEILQKVSNSENKSFLTVLKFFGEIPPRGLMSFPSPGYTIAFDFRNKGKKTEKLFSALDEIVGAANGKLYSAKDARMPAELFHSTSPNLSAFRKFVDPKFSSNFWRRVNGEAS